MSGTIRERRTPEIPTVVLGAVLLGVGLAWLLDATDAANVSWRVVLPGVLIAIGLGLVAGAITGGRQGGLLPAGIALTIFLTVLWVLPEDLGSTFAGGVGERTESPSTVTDQRARYRLGVGQLNVDLRNLDLEVGATRIRAQVGIGQLVVRVPANAAVRAHGRSGIGNVRVLRCEASGVGADRECETDGYPEADEQVSLELEVGIGQIEVRRDGAEN
ncbi:MAG TPA: LiaF domain-containing protein [Actinomycetota bacterium]|jgi:hypothetical protein|nr:LiaF domain-containing protein [Actinomycetota bacterium]